jgi:hypothetical protein
LSESVRYAPPGVSDDRDSEGLRGRLSRQGEEALGKLAEELATNSLVSSAIAGAFEARERAAVAQEAAMGALGIPSAADIERLTRRVRSVSQRLEGIEDALDRLDSRLGSSNGPGQRTSGRGLESSEAGQEALERRLDELKADVAALRDAVAPAGEPVPTTQERLAVAEAEPPKRRRRRTTSRPSG